MRTLKYRVKGQKILRDPDCDFRGIAPGTENYLSVIFDFSTEWAGTVKVCEFSAVGVQPVPVPVTGNHCMVPAEVLTGREFTFRLIGKRGKYKITTSQVKVQQEV